MSPADLAALKRDLERLYLAEFLSRWQAYLAAMEPRPVTSLADNIQRLRDASGPLSPIGPLVRAVAKATDMTPAKALAKPPTGVLGKVAGAVMGGASGDDPRRTVVDAFLPLRIFVGIPPGGGKPQPNAPIDVSLATLAQLADKLNIIAVLPGGGGESGAAQSLEVRALVAQLDQSANGMPAPAGVWFKSVASDANVALGGARLMQMSAAMNESFGDACAQVLTKSFPVQPAAPAELAMPDFTRFFSPQGLFARFVSEELGGYIDTTAPTWQPRPNAGEIGLTEANVRAMQAANTVTRLFFASDPNTARLVYQIEPVALTGAEKVTLQIDGQTLAFDGKVAVPVTFDWPGNGGAAVEFALADSTAPEVRAWPGQWSVFRMMRAAAIKAGASPAIGEGSLTQAGARFNFRVRTFGSANPFVTDPFVKISCPAQLATSKNLSPLMR